MVGVRRRSLVLSSLLAAACQWHGIEPQPLRGPAPRLILIAPVPQAEGRELGGAALLHGVEPALRARGYDVLPLQTGFDLLRQHGLDAADPADLAAIARSTAADAVLRVGVREFTFKQDDMLERASYALSWQLQSTAGTELWSFELSGDYVRPEDTTMSVVPGHEDEQLPQPLGVSRQRPFRDAADLLANLHRAAFERLPAVER